MAKKAKAYRALVFRVGQAPVEEHILNDLRTWQKIVDGNIQRLAISKNLILYCDEEGRFKKKPPNRGFRAMGTPTPNGAFAVYMEDTPGELARPGQEGAYVFVGDFFIVRETVTGVVQDLTNKDVEFLKTLFGAS